MDIQPLTPERAADFFDFFRNRAFTDNPYWKGCYCTFFHLPKKEPEGERPTRRVLAETLIRDGELKGYLAYDQGQVVGWVNANRKTAYRRFEPVDPRTADPAEADTLAIVCFVIDPLRRRQGIARALLARVLEDAAAAGFRRAEAYPSARARSDGGHFHGPLALYESLGFELLPGKKWVVRKALQG